MKRFSSVLCAFVLAGCASAAQQAAKSELGTPRPAPSAEQLAAAPIITADAAPFAERPSLRHFMAAFPRTALQQGVDGGAELECLVEDDYRLACRILSERPANAGFGEAALSLSPLVRVEPTLASGAPTRGGRLYWDVNFNSTGRHDLTNEIPLPGSAAQSAAAVTQ